MKVIYNTLYGSRAYGINELDSDYDLRMVYVPSKREKLLINSPDLVHVNKYTIIMPKEVQKDLNNMKLDNYEFHQLKLNQDKIQLKNDSSISILDYKKYELNRFKEGLYSSNVECVEMLYCQNLDINYTNDIFKPLLDNKDEFITIRLIERYLSTSVSAIKEINKNFNNTLHSSEFILDKKGLTKHLKNMYRCYISAISIIKNSTLQIDGHKDFILDNINNLISGEVSAENILYDVSVEMEKYLDMIKFTTDVIKHSKIRTEVNKDKIDDIIISIYEQCGI